MDLARRNYIFGGTVAALTGSFLTSCGGGGDAPPTPTEIEFDLSSTEAPVARVSSDGTLSIVQPFNNGSRARYAFASDDDGTWLSGSAVEVDGNIFHMFNARSSDLLPATVIDSNSGQHLRVSAESGNRVLRVFEPNGSFIEGYVVFEAEGRTFVGRTSDAVRTERTSLIDVVDVSALLLEPIKFPRTSTVRTTAISTSALSDVQSCRQGLISALPGESLVYFLAGLLAIVVFIRAKHVGVAAAALIVAAWLLSRGLKLTTPERLESALKNCFLSDNSDEFNSPAQLSWSFQSTEFSNCQPDVSPTTPVPGGAAGVGERVAEGRYRISGGGFTRVVSVPGRISYTVQYAEGDPEGLTTESGRIRINRDGTITGAGDFVFVRTAPPNPFTCSGTFILTGQYTYSYPSGQHSINLPV